MKNLNDPIGSRTRDLPVCRVVPQPPALPRTPAPTLEQMLKCQW